jgi:WXXGXW repeat (2 copies)
MRTMMRVVLAVGFVGAITVGMPVLVSAQYYPPPQDYDAPQLISADVPPPPLPVYEQPIIPGPGYLWVPGYWAWSDDFEYYWVPGTWVLAPEPGLLWTPAYWAWNDGEYVFYPGYWGTHVGFYGGVNYGFGYTGEGYEGGYWRGGTFFYNTTVNNISKVSITNVYTRNVVVNNSSNVSYNGGQGGITARPTAEQFLAARERHLPPRPEQVRHLEAAAQNPSLLLSNNHGHPAVAATSSPALFRGPGVVAARPGNPIQAAPVRGLGSGNLAPPQSTDDHTLPVPKGNGLGITTRPAFGTNERNLPRPGADLTEPQRERSRSAFPSSTPPPERHGPPPSFPQTPRSSGPSPYPNAAFRPPTPGPTGPLPHPSGPPLDRRPPPGNTKCPPGQQHC